MNEANEYLHSIPRVSCVEDAKKHTEKDVLLLCNTSEFSFRDDNLIQTSGFDSKLDKKTKDLIRIIEIIDPLNIKYKKTNILTPLVYAESLPFIPWHLNTQGVLFVRVTSDTLKWIKKEHNNNIYGKHQFDQFWLPFCKNIDSVKEGELLCIFNRRVAGWDGSHDRPVIELLGAGGHLPTVWDKSKGGFRELSFKENFQKEFREELGNEIKQEDIVIFGGYQNDITHELVVLCGIEVKHEKLVSMQEYAYQNIDDNTAGIYLGTFQETVEYYRKNPEPFAGGRKAAPYNFPNRNELMKKAIEYYEQRM